MGLLDQFGSMSDDQQQGLLAAASQMLQQSGPSLRPMGLGQILGGGMGAYQDSTNAARKRKLEEDAAKQSAMLRGLQIQEAQGGLADHDRARQQADALRQFYVGDRTGAAPTAPAPQMASAMPGGEGSPASAPQAQSSSPDIFAQRMNLAQRLRAAGHHAEADAQEAAALKFRDEYSMTPQVMRGTDGTIGNYQLSKFGSAPRNTNLGVAEKLNFQDAGGSIDGLDPYSGKQVTTLAKTGTPDGVLNRAQAERHFNTEQSAPQYMDTSDGIMALPKRLAPGAAPSGRLVMGPDGTPLEKKQNTPQYVVQAITGNAKSLSSIDAALASLGTDNGKNAVGMKGYLPNAMLNRMYPEGTETRANISDVGSLILHDRSGAAVTAAESPRLMPFIPLATDDAVTAKKKLTRFKQIFEAETNNLTFAFPQAKKLAEYAASTAPSKAAPAPVNSDGWTLHTDASGNQAYVSPDGKQFKEAP